MGFTTSESFLRSILDLFRSTTASGFVTKTVTLSGTATALPDFKCKAIEFLATIDVTSGSGVAITFTNGGVLPCNNASEILVSGSGDVDYIIYI